MFVCGTRFLRMYIHCALIAPGLILSRSGRAMAHDEEQEWHSALSPGCRAVELSRLRRAAVEVLSRPCLSSLSSSCRVAVEPVEASRD